MTNLAKLKRKRVWVAWLFKSHNSSSFFCVVFYRVCFTLELFCLFIDRIVEKQLLWVIK